MTTHLKFRIGEKWVCVEDGNGYAPEHPDYVTFAIRDAKPNGKPGGRSDANFSVHRRTVLEIGLRLLELAERMTPETTWQNSQTVGETGQAPLTFTFAEVDRAVLDRLLADRPLNFAHHAYASAERLRASPSRRAARTRTLRRRDGRRPARADRGRRSDRRVPREADRRI
ncbi:MAG: hypothetical protein AB1704_42355 [Pseudomonadota bacterium]